MKKNKYPQTQKSAGASQSMADAESNKNENDFAPSPDVVARKSYFSYVNQGSSQGHEVQHWLEAEAQLLAKRDLTRVHGFHHKT
jgi:hypothetical protein